MSSSNLVGDVQMLEKAQRSTARLVSDLRGLLSENQLNRMNLFSLASSSARVDLILVVIMLIGSYRTPVDQFVTSLWVTEEIIN